MADLNSFSFTGRCSKDAVVKKVGNNVLMEVDVANNIGYGNYATTNWLKVKMWGERCYNIAEIFKKGTVVAGQGELTTNEWTGNDGSKHVDLVVTVFNLQVISSKCKGCSDVQNEKKEEDSEQGELPF